jgi:hypothetical protein
VGSPTKPRGLKDWELRVLMSTRGKGKGKPQGPVEATFVEKAAVDAAMRAAGKKK